MSRPSLSAPESAEARATKAKVRPIFKQTHLHRAWATVTGKGLGGFLARAVAGSGIVRICAMAASFALGVLLARGLGVEGYGYYSIALAVIAIASIPGEFGLPILITREVAAAASLHDYPKLFGVLRWANRMSGLIAGSVAIAVAAAAIVVYRTGEATIGEALLLGAPVIPLIALAKVRSSTLQGLNHVVRGQIPQNLLRPLIFIALIAAALLSGLRLTAPAAMALNSVTAAAVFLIAHRWLKQRLPDEVPAEVVRSGRRWLASTIPMGLMDGIRVLQAELSILLVGLVAAPALVGLLRIANVTAQLAAVAIIVLTHATMPVMARLHAQADKPRLQKTVTGVAQAQFAGVLAVSLPLLLFPAQLISLAFGPSFAPAADVLRILLAGQIANSAFGPNIWLLNMTHHEIHVARAMTIALALNIVLVPLLAIGWGLAGAAVAMLVSMLCWNLISWRDSKRLLGIETSIFHWPWR